MPAPGVIVPVNMKSAKFSSCCTTMGDEDWKVKFVPVIEKLVGTVVLNVENVMFCAGTNRPV